MSVFHKNIDVLKIFQGIDPSVVESILRDAERVEILSGEIIMEQGDMPDGNGYIIEEGEVDVWVNGNQTATLYPGEMFGEFALLNEEPRSATIIAKEPTRLIPLSQDTLFEMIQNDDNSINKEIIRRMEENLENEGIADSNS